MVGVNKEIGEEIMDGGITRVMDGSRICSDRDLTRKGFKWHYLETQVNGAIICKDLTGFSNRLEDNHLI